MSRVFWDAMLFIYLVEDHPDHFERCRYLLERSYERGDTLFTSHLALGEVLACGARSRSPEKTNAIRTTATDMGFLALPFDADAVLPFSKLRGERKLQVADSIHLACAASAGIDLFLTGNQQLSGVHVPGIQFIANFQSPIL